MNYPGVKNGLFLGIALTVLSLVIYLISPQFFVAGWGMAFSGISLLVYLFFMIMTGRNYKSDNEGFASFGEILKPIFITALIGGVMHTIFNYCLFNFIDPDLANFLQDTMMANFEDSGFLSEDQIEEMQDQMEAENSFDPSISKTMLNAGVGAIVGFIISLIIAAVQKKDRPEDILM